MREGWNVNRPRSFTIVLFAFLCVMNACSSPADHGDGIPSGAGADRNAELMAIYLSGELEAPLGLYVQISRELRAIRSRFGSEFGEIREINFKFPAPMDETMIAFDDTTAAKVDAGEYRAWDELNERLNLVRMRRLYGSSTTWVLYFDGTFHPVRLAEIYEELPGIERASPNWYIGDWPCIMPRLTGGGITYLFRNAWGDECCCFTCGCEYSEYWYFTIEYGRPVFVGYSECTWYGGCEEPAWWPEAKQNLDQYCIGIWLNW